MSSTTTRRSISSVWTVSSPAFRKTLRRAPPPPPTQKSRRITRIPVTPIIIPETDGDDPFSDFHSSITWSSSSSSSLSSSSSSEDEDDDDFDPTTSIRCPERLPSLPLPISTRMWELQNIPCPEGRCKLVAGKILNRGGRSMRCSRKCREGYVRSSLSNVVLSAPAAEDI